MKPKEKAQQLIKKMTVVGLQMRSEGIQCAIIAIDEMIMQNGELYLNGIDADYYRKINSFLFEVKQEIEKL